MTLAYLILAFLAFATLSIFLVPPLGMHGFFYAWLGANICVVAIAFFFTLKEVP